MKANEGAIDRAIRIIGGMILIMLAASGAIGGWGLIGILPLLTGIVGFCPGYAIFGMNTCGHAKTD